MENQNITVSIERKKKLIDTEVHTFSDGMPMPAWIEVSPIESCNRRCAFCPRADRKRYPNQPLMMNRKLAQKIADELGEMKYRGTVVLSGYGEPMMHKDIFELVCIFSHVARVEMVTNGDYLSENSARRLLESGISMVSVSMYDGPEQEVLLRAMFEAAGVPAGKYMLRDRWHGPELDYGVKLTNRAGTVRVGDQPPVVQRACYYPHYSMMVDWNGDCLLCTQDWNRRVKFGNLNLNAVWEVWSSYRLSSDRMLLYDGRRIVAPCVGCNAEGTVHGQAHAEAWERYYALMGRRNRPATTRAGEGSAS